MGMLLVEGLQARYGKSQVLHHVDLRVDAGETVCLIGRNGVGKSTTMKTIMGLVRPAGGSIYYRGNAIGGRRPHRIAHLGIGYVPEERRVFPTITVGQNLLMGAKAPAGGGPPRWSRERVYRLLPRLRERERQRGGTLSGGEQQMLTLGRTLMGNPDLILVDEPTEGLAPMIVEQVERVLQEIQADGTAVLLVEQSMETALSLAHRAYVMSKGVIVFDGTVEELGANSEVRRQYLEV